MTATNASRFDLTGLEGYVTDRALEQEGVWVAFPGDREFLILRAGGSNREFARALSAVLKPYRRQIEKGTLDPSVSEGLMRQLYARHIIKDWRGIKDAAGNQVPYSVEACVEFMTALPDLFSDIVTMATEMATFSRESMEEAKAVLGEASNGS